MKNKKYYSSKIQSKKLYKEAKYKITQFTWLGTGASIQKMTRVEVKLVLCTKTLHRP
jgi:hypothetical protein